MRANIFYNIVNHIDQGAANTVNGEGFVQDRWHRRSL